MSLRGKWLSNRVIFLSSLLVLSFLWKIVPGTGSYLLLQSLNVLRAFLFLFSVFQITLFKEKLPDRAVGSLFLNSLSFAFLTLPFWAVYLFWIVDFHPLGLPFILIYEFLWEFVRLTAVFLVPVCFEIFPWMAVDYLKSLTGSFAFPWGSYPLMLSQVGFNGNLSHFEVNVAFLFPKWLTSLDGVGSPYFSASAVLAILWIGLCSQKSFCKVRRRAVPVYIITILVFLALFVPDRYARRVQPEGSFSASHRFSRVVLVQPLIDPGWGYYERKKRLQSMLDELDKFLESKTSQETGDYLIVLPENVFKYPLDMLPEYRTFKNFAISNGVYLLAGANRLATRGDSTDKSLFYNTAFLFTPDGKVFTYDKAHLVPFGEYVPEPFCHLPFVKRIVESAGGGGFVSGESYEPIYDGLGVLICFESAFLGISKREVMNGAKLLINITNDYWSRSTFSHVEHFKFALFTALKFSIPMIRCGNSGVSAVIVPWSKSFVVFSLPPFKKCWGVCDLSRLLN